MKSERKTLPKSRLQLTIEITAEEFQKYYQQAVKKLSAQASIPGFRKGHIPEKMLLERFGEELIAAEAVDIAIPQLLSTALASEKTYPLDRPDVELVSMQPFKFSAAFSVLPEIDLGKWQDVRIPKKKLTVAKKEIAETIDKLQGNLMERSPVERASRKGDFVEIDFAGKTPDGVPLDGTVSRMHPLILGEGNFIPGFEEELIGMEKGTEKQFTVTFPKDYHAKHLAGKDVVFDVKLHTVHEQKKPVVDEAFAERIFGKKLTVAEFETEIEKILLDKAEDQEQSRRENELIQTWTDIVKLELPAVLINEEADHLIGFMKQRLEGSGIPWDKHLRNLGKTEDEVRKGLLPEAENRAKQRLVLSKIIAEANIEVTDAEIDAAIARHDLEHAEHGHAGHNHDRKETEHQLRVTKLFARFLDDDKHKEHEVQPTT